MDPWKHRSSNMRCSTCMHFVLKALPALTQIRTGPSITEEAGAIGRCRRHAPNMNGFPVVFSEDWCGDHKIDEEKI